LYRGDWARGLQLSAPRWRWWSRHRAKARHSRRRAAPSPCPFRPAHLSVSLRPGTTISVWPARARHTSVTPWSLDDRTTRSAGDRESPHPKALESSIQGSPSLADSRPGLVQRRRDARPAYRYALL